MRTELRTGLGEAGKDEAESAAQRRMRIVSAHVGLKGQHGERVWG